VAAGETQTQKQVRRRLRGALALVCLGLCFAPTGSAYSVLTHEQIVDVAWKDHIEPLLRKRFPGASEDEIRKAHAFAYGGSIVQDMGYYPFGNAYFSDLVHYVRSGDFVEALIRDSSDVNEYAFALGALAHYSSDNQGHPTINRVVAMEFPKLRARYGNQVSYADDPKAHIRTEFGFDMVQVAKNRYTSDRYHDFIGFEVARPLLERAFLDTYGLKLEDVIPNPDMAIGSFRRGVSVFIPEMTRVALLSRKDEIVKDTPNFNEKKFLYYLSRADYEKNWGTVYRKPGMGTRILAGVLKIIPKVGPFKAVNFKIPTQQTEDLYIKSVNLTVENYSALLRQEGSGPVELADTDLDTGNAAKAGEYSLADKTYARLLADLQKQNFAATTRDLGANILEFYAGGSVAPARGKKQQDSWNRTQEQLAALKARQLASPLPAIDPAAGSANHHPGSLP
jgi:hypothetical protein